MKIIKLSQGKSVKVDNEDFEWLNKFKWYCHCGYATRSKYLGVVDGEKTQTTLRMHIAILEKHKILKYGFETDHINRNRLDNRKVNLRVCTKAENLNNKSMYKVNKSGLRGVNWHKASNKWMAQITVNGIKKYLGVFKDKLDAYEKYKEMAKKNQRHYANI